MFLARWCGNFRCCFVSATATILLWPLLFSFLPQLKVKIQVFTAKGKKFVCMPRC
ncbi:hypothetical protein M5D96_000079 [Drosophila gunungcola]|uniref:Uncharacterized protein n=1 Tax=Drosophila gunungcola TaxID=103775 RepID=A0A9P9YVM7_9MUSC|nr:hypothetical protein M5D96_000079 [Drosophila gunungcola]